MEGCSPVSSVRILDVGGTFETIRYANKQNVTLDALGGHDIITSIDATVGTGEISRTLIGNDGHDRCELGGSDVTALVGQGNDNYVVAIDSSPATLTIGDILGEFAFDGAIFGYGGSGNDLLTPVERLGKTLCFEGGGDVDVLRGSDGSEYA